jgi:hypothetical protein
MNDKTGSDHITTQKVLFLNIIHPLLIGCLYTYLLGKLLETKSYNGTKDM